MEYRHLLVNISHMLRPEEFQATKYMCRDVLKARKLEECTTPLKLWEALEEKEKMGKHNTEFLKDLLKTATNDRRDLLRCLEEYEQTRNYLIQTDAETYDAQKRMADMRRVILFLSTKLYSKEWKFFMRTLCIPETEIDSAVSSNPNNVKNQIHSCLTNWVNAQKHSDKDGIVQAILLALQSLPRNDLVNELQQSGY